MPSQRKTRSRWWVVALLVILFAAIVAFALYRSKTATPVRQGRGGMMAGRATPVATATATKGDLPVYLNALGTVTPLNIVTVRSRADGELQKIHFTEGQAVHAGDLLAEIDPRAYQAALDQAVGQLGRDQALLENARRDLERYENAHEAVTQQQIDTAKATVAQYEATVRADGATIESDKLQLSYCRITAPIDGVVGLRQVDPGNIVHPSDSSGLVVITQEQPITIVFSIPEENLPQVRKALANGEKLRVEAYDRALQTQLAVGEVLAVDNQIDATTGTLRIKALFPNADRSLYPNQFVNVRLLVQTLQDVTLIPNSAIQLNGQTRFVFVVKPDNTVERRTVKVTRSEGEQSAIGDGLAAGEIVVTQGLDRLEEGAKVTAQTPPAGNGSGASVHPHNGNANGKNPNGAKHGKREKTPDAP